MTVDTTGDTPKPLQARRRWPFAIACLALAIGLGSTLSENRQLKQDLEAERVRVDRFATELTRRTEYLDMLRGPLVRMATLAGQQAVPDASARVFWRPSDRAWLVSVSNLPILSLDKTYQLWAVTAGGQVNLGMFQIDEGGGAVFKATLPAPDLQPTGAVVTIEPTGGRPKPTGAIALTGVI